VHRCWLRLGGRRAVSVDWGYVEGMARSTAIDAHQGQPEIHADLQDVAQQVHQEFADQLDPRQVDECLGRVAAKFDEAKIRSFVPLLVRRYVREELQASLVHA
jgi:hypothetical protein